MSRGLADDFGNGQSIGWSTEPKKQMLITCGKCGVEFDLLTAKPCKHNKEGLGTMECPNGHCVCDKPIGKFRQANSEEKEFGFEYVLKSAYPKIVEAKLSEEVKE